MAESALIIGVDGGGTKTVAWIAPLKEDRSGVVLGRGHAGPGNPRAAGFDAAQANIARAIEAAFADAKIAPRAAGAACFGLAGAGRAVEQDSIAAWAEERGLAERVLVTGDAELVLAAACDENYGVALICGTGSMAFGRNRAGQTARCGGWGYLLGDEGSAYAIALAGLQMAMRAVDGRGRPTALVDRFQRELGAAEPTQLVERVYSAQMTRERLASLGKVVFEAAKEDEVARAVIADAARQLAEHVVSLGRRLDLAAGDFPLALAGSVALNQRELREAIVAQLRADGLAPKSVELIAEPVRGALALARRIATIA
jgi:N-acetylmuramic acid 6-phosphate etherase